MKSHSPLLRYVLFVLALLSAHCVFAWDPLPVHEDQNLFMPGSQPGDLAFDSLSSCNVCHGDYNPDVEPLFNWRGSMMAQAARDPLWLACLAVADQDSIWALGNPNAGDLCLRCHTPGGWLAGRSDPPNGTALLVDREDYEGVSCEFCHRLVDPLNALQQLPSVPPETNATATAKAEETYAADFQVLTNISLFDGAPFLDPESRLPTHYQSGGITHYSEATSGQFFVDPGKNKRGPRYDAQAMHDWSYSRFHRSEAVCGTCHDVSNPVLANVLLSQGVPERQAAASYFHVERTWSEFVLSAYARGAGSMTNPRMAETGVDGARNCQDCHMSSVPGTAAKQGFSPYRPDIARHDLTGGNVWMSRILASLDKEGSVFSPNNDAILSGSKYPGAKLEVNGLQGHATALIDGEARALANLRRAAELQLLSQSSTQAALRIWNNTGHKLISGFPEGRRMWLAVEFYDEQGVLVGAENAYEPLIVTTNGQEQLEYVSGGTLNATRDDLVYEAKLGSTLTEEQTTFHFVLATHRYKDNRIPPKGFDIGAAADRLVDPYWHGAAAPDYFTQDEYLGGYDDIQIALPTGTATWKATLFYQTTSKEYVEFLRDEISGSGVTLSSPTPSGEPAAYIIQDDPFFAALADWGDALWELWLANGGAAPVVMTELVPSPTITATSMEESDFHIRFSTTPTVLYQVQRTSNLSESGWTNTGSPQSGQGGVVNFVDPGVGTDRGGYYRVVALTR